MCARAHVCIVLCGGLGVKLRVYSCPLSGEPNQDKVLIEDEQMNDCLMSFNIVLLLSFTRARQVPPGNRTSPYQHLPLHKETLLLHLLLNALLPSPLRAEPPGWQCLPPPQGFLGTYHCPQRPGAQKILVTWQRAEQEWSAHPNLPMLLLLTSMEDP